MRRVFRENSLSIVLFGLFAVMLFGQSVSGHRSYNEDQQAHGQPAVGFVEYLGTGHFVESVFENWESEFLQMSAFVLFTIFLRQKGSPDSKPLEGSEPSDADPSKGKRANVSRPVRRGGLVLVLYENSLTIALFLLFVISLVLHALGGARAHNAEQLEHGGATVSTAGYVMTSRFWFESLQNWQSEFLSVGALTVLSIVLRQKGSPQSKPVAAPNDETGTG
ncbi:MAG TPA: DUF6766 family protein [Actinomycetota bacterium]|jgi:hypothetical protein|nr:DUF6766 family protein [Actinomycetota bacterium]